MYGRRRRRRFHTGGGEEAANAAAAFLFFLLLIFLGIDWGFGSVKTVVALTSHHWHEAAYTDSDGDYHPEQWMIAFVEGKSQDVVQASVKKRQWIRIKDGDGVKLTYTVGSMTGCKYSPKPKILKLEEE